MPTIIEVGWGLSGAIRCNFRKIKCLAVVVKTFYNFINPDWIRTGIAWTNMANPIFFLGHTGQTGLT